METDQYNRQRKLTRRQFVQAAGVGVAVAASSAKPSSVQAAPDRAHEHGKPLYEFGYGEVKFAPGPHQAQLEQTHAILMGLDEDGLLRPFRLAAGLPAPGRDLGGWHSSIESFGPESFGYWMSALSRYYAATGEAATRAKVERWLELFSATIDSEGSLFKQFRTTSTCIYNKLFCGLQDAWHFAGLAPALEVLKRMTTAAVPYLPGCAFDQNDARNICESYIIPEYQFLAWQWGAEARHLQIARDYIHDGFFEPLARGENVLPGYHAYSHANALSSAAKAYLVLGDEKYLRAAANGFRFMEQQSYATGAWGAGESFLPQKWSPEKIEEIRKDRPEFDPSAYASLGDAILKLKTHFETPCGSNAHFKLTRYLLRITKDAHYGDSMERVMYNCALGALPLNKFGKAFYQSNYSKYATKTYFDGYGNIMEDEWPCCSGTLPQLAADYRVSTYFRDEDGVFANLYIPSTLRWRYRGTEIAMTQSGQYPLDDQVIFSIDVPKPVTFSVRLRIPGWARGPSIEVNGERISTSVTSGSFATIRRRWQPGDRIVLTLPASVELKEVDAAHPELVAVVQGPIVLFAIGYDLPKLDRKTLLAVRQSSPGSVEWKIDDVRFLPWWAIKDEVYTTYYDVA